MVDNDLQQWLPCPGGELDRLEVRLRQRRFWQTLGVWSAVVAASLTVGLASWQVAKAVWPSSWTDSQSCPTNTTTDDCQR